MTTGPSFPGGPDAGFGDRLPCGAEIDELLEQVSVGRGDQRDSHQAQCPHCQAALAEYDRLWAPVRQAAHTKVEAPDSVLEEAFRRIRGAVTDPEYGSLPGPTGTTRISARVVVVTARETTQDVVGVRVALSKLVTAGVAPVEDHTTAGDTTASDTTIGDTAGEGSRAPVRPVAATAPHDDGLRVVAGISGRSTAVEVTLAADYGTDLIALGERIRVQVAAKVSELTGLTPVAVTVRIEDVFD